MKEFIEERAVSDYEIFDCPITKQTVCCDRACTSCPDYIKLIEAAKKVLREKEEE